MCTGTRGENIFAGYHASDRIRRHGHIGDRDVAVAPVDTNVSDVFCSKLRHGEEFDCDHLIFGTNDGEDKGLRRRDAGSGHRFVLRNNALNCTAAAVRTMTNAAAEVITGVFRVGGFPKVR